MDKGDIEVLRNKIAALESRIDLLETEFSYLNRILIEDPGNDAEIYSSEWILLARDPTLLDIPAIRDQAVPMESFTPHIRLWTDDYSNLFNILKY